MKKIVLFLLIFALSNCEIKVKETKAQATEHWTEAKYWRADPNYPAGTHFKRIKIDSMEYGLFQCDGGHGTGIPFIINLTKDKLEVELLRQKLKSK